MKVAKLSSASRGRKRNQRSYRQYRRHRNLSILAAAPSLVPVPPESDVGSGIFDLKTMIQICKTTWSIWLSQISVARIQQVAILSEKPSIENIDLLQDLEKLGVKVGRVSELE